MLDVKKELQHPSSNYSALVRRQAGLRWRNPRANCGSRKARSPLAGKGAPTRSLVPGSRPYGGSGLNGRGIHSRRSGQRRAGVRRQSQLTLAVSEIFGPTAVVGSPLPPRGKRRADPVAGSRSYGESGLNGLGSHVLSYWARC